LSIGREHVRLGIEAPSEVEVHREEVYLELRQANRQAVSTSTEALANLASVLPKGREPSPPAGGPRSVGQYPPVNRS